LLCVHDGYVPISDFVLSEEGSHGRDKTRPGKRSAGLGGSGC